MKLIDLIAIDLIGKDLHSIVLTLGYRNTKRGLSRIASLLKAPSFSDWMANNTFDLVHGNRDFIIKLCGALDIPESVYLTELKTFESSRKKLADLRNAYIFVDTGFKRKDEPIFILAFMECRRRLALQDPERFVDASSEAILAHVGDIIQEHHQNNDGKLTVWGKIESYTFFYADETYLFNTQGIWLKGMTTPSRSCAEMTIDGRHLDICNASLANER